MSTYVGKKREVERTTIRQRFRDAINAFRGKKIGSVQFGIEVKKCSECRNPIVFYLCDGNACDGACTTSCKHTTDIRHAKNFKHGLDGESWWEKEEV